MLLNLNERPLERRRRGRRNVSRQFWIRPGRVKTWWENFYERAAPSACLCHWHCLFEGDSPVYAKEQKRSSVV